MRVGLIALSVALVWASAVEPPGPPPATMTKPATVTGPTSTGPTSTGPNTVVEPAGGSGAGSAVSAGSYGWPLWPPPVVGRPFQPPSLPYGPGHRGVDLVGAAGQAVLAAGSGVVVYAAPLADRGVVSVDHAAGLRTTYEPVSAAVRPGQVVARGQPLGVLVAGHAGCAGTACLHWGLRRERVYLDPLLLVRPARVRLLPHPPDRP